MTFTERELEFLNKEFGISAIQAGQLSEEELLELGDRCFDIELEGDLQDGSKMPDRCGIASGILDKLNA
jgi:hypothetical protein